MKVALVNMPFGSIFRPSIGLSLLQAALKQRDFECDTYYLNILFTSMIPLESYVHIVESGEVPTAAIAGEWVFSQALFGRDNGDAYMAYIRENHFRSSPEKLERFRKHIFEVREHVEPFFDRAFEEVDWASYDVIGFTSVFEQNVASLTMAKRIKERWPDKVIVFGGANCEAEMGRTLIGQFPFIDAVCSGEGDISFPSFMERLRETGDLTQCQVQGITLHARWQTDLHLASFDGSPPVHDMDALPIPDYDDYFSQFEHHGFGGSSQPPRFLFESSRGCWWGAKSHCKFCGLNGQTLSYRSKSADRALDELLFLREKYAPYTNKAAAVDNIIDMQYFRDFLPKIRDMQLDLDMFYETKANLTRDQVKLFKDAGFHMIQPGIESLITSVLRLMRKGVSMMQNVQLLKHAKEFGVKPMWNFLYGFPGEDPAEYQRVLDICRALTHLDPPMAAGPIRLDRFSPYFNEAEANGIRNVRPLPAYFLVYQDVPQEAMMHMACYFDFDYAQPLDHQAYSQGLHREVHLWQEGHTEAEFFSVDAGSHLILIDLRKIAEDRNMTAITGLEKTLYQFCDNIRSIKTIAQHLSEQGISFTLEEVQGILDKFVDRKWMLTEQGVYLNLSIALGHYQPKKKGLEKLLALTGGKPAPTPVP